MRTFFLPARICYVMGVTSEENGGNLVWLDLEMTGLEPERDTILEIATIITDGNLEVLEEGPHLAIHHPDDVLDAMDPWCVEQHGKSGLTERVRRSRVSMAQAEAKTLEFVSRLCPRRTAPLCGNTIGQDRRFLFKYMPELSEYLHYRSVDVTSIKELVRRWYPEDRYAFPKSNQHQALEDVRASIEEMRHYRRTVFKPS